MKVLIDRLFRWTDEHDPAYKSWSRPYEYWFAVGAVIAYGITDSGIGPNRVHNVACGSWNAAMPWATHVADYRRFWDSLRSPGHMLTLSDLFPCDGTEPAEYCTWDMLTPWEGKKQDVVLCISALEHLDADYRAVAEHNLYEQLKPRGLLVITQDESVPEYPPEDLLTGANSIYPQPEYANLYVRVRAIWRDA